MKQTYRVPKGFKDIKGYENRYAISKHGEIWSYPKRGNDGRMLNPGKAKER